jgi:hypothetical protein
MTPKEKAQKLVERYYNHSKCNLLSPFEAKQCALIAVDEILSLLWSVKTDVKYFSKVKKEIEKL